MKNKIILILVLAFALSSSCVFAIEDTKVVSDAAKQKELLESFDEVNQYTNNLFTPNVQSYVPYSYVDNNIKYTEGEINRQLNQHNTLPPIKKLRLLYLQSRLKNEKNAAKNVADADKKNVYRRAEINKTVKSKTDSVVASEPPPKDQAILDCDVMEYFAERTELEANGNVVMVFPQNNSAIKADRMVYNQTSNIIKAFGHVVLINGGKEMKGDFLQVDMNEENAVMDEPVTDYLQVHAKAKKGYMYGDKLIQEQGRMLCTKKTLIDVRAEMFGPDLDNMFVENKDRSYIKKNSHGEKLKIKTNELIINSKKEHDTLTLKHAELYFGEQKLAVVPTITIHTNKTQDYAEANFPEFGTMNNMGAYIGPGFVFDTPHGSTLKLVPVLNYGNNDSKSEDNKFGFGGIAKFKSGTNKTDMAYGSTNQIFIMRGYQKLDDHLYFQYGANGYMDDWFMGYRLPKMLGEVIYQDMYPQKDFLGRNRGMLFTQRIAAGYMQDGGARTPIFDSEGGIGTLRLKYMAEVAQTLYRFGSPVESPINASFDIVGQESTALYGTGQSQIIGRIGPRIHTQYKSWMQDVGYFLSGYQDNTPFGFDRYVYGRSNAYMRESFRLCKYLTLSWMGSLNLSQDSWDGNMIQENTFFFAIGPDDIRLNIGYDTIRQQSFVTMTMHLDAKGSTIEYKKMVIKNPDTLGKKKDGQNTTADGSGTMFSPFKASADDDLPELERAEVINVNNGAL